MSSFVDFEKCTDVFGLKNSGGKVSCCLSVTSQFGHEAEMGFLLKSAQEVQSADKQMQHTHTTHSVSDYKGVSASTQSPACNHNCTTTCV